MYLIVFKFISQTLKYNNRLTNSSVSVYFGLLWTNLLDDTIKMTKIGKLIVFIRSCEISKIKKPLKFELQV